MVDTAVAAADTRDFGPKPDSFLDETGGILPLRPNYVRRYYRDGGRLLAKAHSAVCIHDENGPRSPERWIASTVTADNPEPIPGEGLSFSISSAATSPSATPSSFAEIASSVPPWPPAARPISPC